jgi:hypothetical protein
MVDAVAVVEGEVALALAAQAGQARVQVAGDGCPAPWKTTPA